MFPIYSRTYLGYELIETEHGAEAIKHNRIKQEHVRRWRSSAREKRGDTYYITGDGSLTKRPPKDAINALISFGNTLLYQTVATEIHKTSLDIRISFIHSAERRTQSLNLDIKSVDLLPIYWHIDE